MRIIVSQWLESRYGQDMLLKSDDGLLEHKEA
jgi:hypothetical protein